ncbi:hypothetical protein BIFCAT_01379 [Bifidobacterium catenulatum DSM 16992 = JCM 1194 = LMG 11043]|uniref:Uncharacterized protein n=1 Tax=Bifidobacterium catenulatum DSM 16992 = JCM 1194 = LMG 11043 TaxID=566552 RepID=B6XVW2_9BIFI|nr:hypothetical protein BIFCAT_01379 [Bifidobacterium catenulatum DSM 16992 = JCM 1194 = LMG 11043]
MACAFPSMVSSQNQSIDVRFSILIYRIIQFFPYKYAYKKPMSRIAKEFQTSASPDEFR